MIPPATLAPMLGFVVALCAVAAQAQVPVDYLREIKPLLQARCFACHGALKQESGLRLDTVEYMLKGSESGPVIVRGDAAKSALLRRVTAADIAQRMPPEGNGEPLTLAHIDLLRRWIAGGAAAPSDDLPEADPREHWAFRPRMRPAVPVVAGLAWVKNPIDAFVARDHQRQGLVPQREAPREALVRRLYLDLVGLPPTMEELAALDAETSADWYELLVERLLADPRHGERWARHWMDVWRYSDWWGLGDQLRNSQHHIWHWRDWIVGSLNDDVPYDEMVRLMLAADELHPNDLDKLRASGYLARNYFLFNRHQWMDETVEHVGKGFLGLTFNCAKCHDHKYDPLAQTDYYRMRAFFEPYHVRLDMLPGEPDLARDGLPRAYDGLPDTPTWLLVRGQENNPDKSRAMTPGVPKALAFAELAIQPVSLPAEAWQPERRAWVIEAHLTAARKKFEAAVVRARGRSADAPVELNIAELDLAAAKAELASVERRAAAMRASWAKTDGASKETQAELEQHEHDQARAAARAEREAALAKAKHAVAVVELRLQQAAADKKSAVEKELAAARRTLEQAVKQLDEPSEQYARFAGAAWTPTRFFNSTKDDPTVVFPPTSSGRRTALAAWITDPRNPLTARVAANQIWMRHLGTPLAATVFDFGRKGSPPTNPELLDWLACELVDSGWSMKHLHRTIVNSATYRLSSSAAGAEGNVAKDRDNLHWWRRTPVRLESQVVRDSILALAGTLDLTRGGPPILAAQQATSTRRSLYFFHSNNDRNLFLTTFDEAAVKDCYRREQSVVPQQALALTNGRLALDAASQIAARLTPAGDAAFVRRAFAVVLGMTASEDEVAASLQALANWQKQDGASAGDARANLVWALLNHNDFVTLR